MANSNDAFVPEFWAAEAVSLMYENFLWGNLVHRDFENEIANMGDTVHTRTPVGFVADRKQNDLDDLATQDAQATNIPVVLDQRVYVSFLIGDGERSKAFQSLVDFYLPEAIAAQVRLIDRCIAARSSDFLGNVAGSLGGLTTSNGYAGLIDSRQVLNQANVPDEGRIMMLANASETLMLKNNTFQSTDYVGGGGQAVRNAFLGRLGGFETFRSSSCSSVSGADVGTPTTVDGAVAAGSTTIVVDAVAPVDWQYITVAGDNTPLRVTDETTLTLTLNRPTTYAIGDGAVVVLCGIGAVDQNAAIAAAQSHGAVADGYPANWNTWMVYDGGVTIKVGQLLAFAGLADEYIVTQVRGTTEFMLDRPLVADTADNLAIDLGPDGDVNFGFNRKAITLVSRPLQLPMEGVGVRSAVIADNGFAIRVTISYDSLKEAHRVTIGSLFGTKTLDTNRGMVFLG